MPKVNKQKEDVSLIVAPLKEQQIEGSKAKIIEDAFLPMIQSLRALETEYNAIIKKPINEETCEEARTLRLKLVKVRTGVAKVHKEQKAEYLRASRAIDGIKNIFDFGAGDKENKLEAIEKHFENIEKEKREAIKQERLHKLSSYEYDLGTTDLGAMDDKMFDILFAGIKQKHEDKLIETARLEKERLANEKASAVALKKAQEETAKLRKESEIKERALKEAQAKAAADKKKQDAIIAEQQRIIKEKEDKEKAEAAAKAKAEAEQAASLKKQARAPDKTRLAKLVQEFQFPDFEAKTTEGEEVFNKIYAKLMEWKEYANKQIERL
jgi:hypothetical protein